MTDKERAELAQMRPVMEANMKEMEASLADVPPEQRAMVERMMRQQMPQMEQMMKQMEALSAAEPTEIVTAVVELRVNQGRPEGLRALKLGPPSS